MSHQIESMAYVNATPWHQLGQQLTPNQSIEVWSQQSGLNFTIQEAPVQFSMKSHEMKSISSFPEQKVLYRSDNGSPLSIVSARYQVVQPSQILEFYRDLTEMAGFELETAGVMKGGRKLWALARTNKSSFVKGNDLMHAYLLLATGCDGTLATTAQFTSIRVVCNNTLAISLDNGIGAIKVPHNTSFNAAAVKQQLGISIPSWDTFIHRMKILSGRKLTANEVDRFLLKLFNDANNGAEKQINARAMKSVLTLYEGQGKGAELSSSKSTAFGLLNAVTQFVDHERRARSADHRRDSAWFGQGANLKQKALDEAWQLVL